MEKISQFHFPKLFYLGYFDFCILCSVSFLFMKAFSSFLFVSYHSISFNVVNDLSFDLCFYIFPQGNLSIFINQRYFCKLNFITGITTQMRHVQGLVFFHLILLTRYFYNCKHSFENLGPERSFGGFFRGSAKVGVNF